MTGAVSNVLRYRTLVRNLVLKDLKLKYRDSFLGVVWSLLHPVLMLGVYTLAFKFILRVPTENYPYFLLVGLLPWTFFASALVASTRAITGSADLIKKVHFPREALPIATVLFAFAQLLLSLAVLLPAAILLSDVRLRWAAQVSPTAAFALAYRDMLVGGRVPPDFVLVALVGWTAAALIGGGAIFLQRSPSFAEEV